MAHLRKTALTLLVLILSVTLAHDVSARKRGIKGQQAPTWEGIQTWFQLPDGQRTLDVTDLKGKVVFVLTFQSWCPGCHSRGFPTLQAVKQHFKGRDDVAFVAMQTVFEGFSSNTEKKALETVRSYGLDIPTAHDPGPRNQGSVVMRRYRSGGTPWIIIIDPGGVVRFNGFHIPASKAIPMVEGLLSRELR
ncbi:MAG: TlpA disulfide reductase family protein [Myxococcota bacterium]|nr:TlpA disulfide reductase family protein [Myxococcota bacterium]